MELKHRYGVVTLSGDGKLLHFLLSELLWVRVQGLQEGPDSNAQLILGFRAGGSLGFQSSAANLLPVADILETLLLELNRPEVAEAPVLTMPFESDPADKNKFQCPDCGGRTWGSEFPNGFDGVQIIKCHDEFRYGCQWKGRDYQAGFDTQLHLRKAARAKVEGSQFAGGRRWRMSRSATSEGLTANDLEKVIDRYSPNSRRTTPHK